MPKADESPPREVTFHGVRYRTIPPSPGDGEPRRHTSTPARPHAGLTDLMV
jgi:hypothetical protein